MDSLALKIDLHVHTCYSSDGTTSPQEVIAYSIKQGLDGVAITDHDTVDGVTRLLGKSDLIIIPGIEITTKQGHVIALNVRRRIPPKLTLYETVQRIHQARGLAVAAHPVALFKSLTIRDACPDFDAIEVINSAAVPFHLSHLLSRKLASRLNLPQVAGSDAHYGPEIGSAYTLIDANPEVEEVVQAIKEGATTPYGKAIPWRLRVERISLSFKRRVRNWSLRE